jgi:hypothetical protein
MPLSPSSLPSSDIALIHLPVISINTYIYNKGHIKVAFRILLRMHTDNLLTKGRPFQDSKDDKTDRRWTPMDPDTGTTIRNGYQTLVAPCLNTKILSMSRLGCIPHPRQHHSQTRSSRRTGLKQKIYHQRARSPRLL